MKYPPEGHFDFQKSLGKCIKKNDLICFQGKLLDFGIIYFSLVPVAETTFCHSRISGNPIFSLFRLLRIRRGNIADFGFPQQILISFTVIFYCGSLQA